MTHAQEIIEKARKKFKENSAYYEMNTVPLNTFVLEKIQVYVDGDWKHDHGYVDWVMQELGCLKVDEQVHFDTGEDWYPSTHTYICVKDTSVIPSGQTEIGFLTALRTLFS